MTDKASVFSHVRSPRLSQLIEDQIKEAIFTGHYQVGERLPSDRELAKICGASRPVVREALRSLETAGFIAIKPGMNGGAFLTPITGKPITDSITAMLRTGQVSHEEILQARLLIEPPVAAEAARCMTPAFIDRLDEANRVLHEGFETEDVYIEHNPDPNLHKVIAEITGNQLIIIIMDMLMDKTVRRQSTIKMDEHGKATVAGDHEAIVAAIKAGDEHQAFESMRRHVRNVYRIHTDLESRQDS